MNLSRRLAVFLVVAVLFLAAYAVGKHYSPLLVHYVVTETLIEKAPAGTDPAALRNRMAALRPARGDGGESLKRLLAISQRLEKVQRLAPEEMEEILAAATARR